MLGIALLFLLATCFSPSSLETSCIPIRCSFKSSYCLRFKIDPESHSNYVKSAASFWAHIQDCSEKHCLAVSLILIPRFFPSKTPIWILCSFFKLLLWNILLNLRRQYCLVCVFPRLSPHNFNMSFLNSFFFLALPFFIWLRHDLHCPWSRRSFLCFIIFRHHYLN